MASGVSWNICAAGRNSDTTWPKQQAFLSRKFIKYGLLDREGRRTLWEWYDRISSITTSSSIDWETQDWSLIVLLAIRIRQDRVQNGIYGKE